MALNSYITGSTDGTGSDGKLYKINTANISDTDRETLENL
jgi:hypothetical protein